MDLIVRIRKYFGSWRAFRWSLDLRLRAGYWPSQKIIAMTPPAEPWRVYSVFRGRFGGLKNSGAARRARSAAGPLPSAASLCLFFFGDEQFGCMLSAQA